MVMMPITRINIPAVTDARGSLAYIERGGEIPFSPASVELVAASGPLSSGPGIVVALRGSLTVGALTVETPADGLLFDSGSGMELSPGGVALVARPVRCGIEVPFDMRRIYYIWDIPAGCTRGGHAHLRQHSLLMAASGSFELTCDDGVRRTCRHLTSGCRPVAVGAGEWRTLHGFSPDAVVLAVASTCYDPTDYLYDHEQFLRRRATLSVS